MVVSENLGEVIFVKEFEEFIKDTGFSIYLCKGYDPSTKGKVEKTVDFVKHQFLDERIYYGSDRLNQEFIDWLDHNGNGMINDTTKNPLVNCSKKNIQNYRNIMKRKMMKLLFILYITIQLNIGIIFISYLQGKSMKAIESELKDMMIS